MSVSLTTQFLTVSVLSLQRQLLHNSLTNRTTFEPSYEYIVVGSGSSGAVVANRLAEHGRRVLLLEAGGPQNLMSDMPGTTPSLVGTELDWQYQTVRQENIGQAFGSGGIINQPKGKVIGGTSTINWMLYNRGNRRSYDNWASSYGAKGWDYDSILPYFRRSENNTSPEIVRDNPGIHGTSGRMGVSSLPSPDPLLYAFQDQMNRFGIPTIDINGESQVGTMIYQLTVKDGFRSGTGNAFIDPNPFPSRLHILANSLVTRVLFDRTGARPKAIGVEFIRDGQTMTVRAEKEVIVSAGCIASPQLLMLSGVGPREHLESLNIPVVADLPVGNNFQDHVFIHQHFELKDPNLANDPVGPTIEQMYDFATIHQGVLTQLPNSVTYFSTSGNDDPQWPNAVIDTNIYSVDSNLTRIVETYATNRTEWSQYWGPYVGKQYALITSAIYRTYSRGTVRLASSDPKAKPLIDPKYLSDERDLEALVNMTKILYFLTMQGPLAQQVQLFPRPIPGCEFCKDRPLYQCDTYVRCIIRQVADSALHPGGACRMGDASRRDVVVDATTRVKGIDSLRVIDSSIIPELANANTHAASVMIGEKGAQLIIDGQ